MALNLNPPPLQTSVDENGRLSKPWMAWFNAAQTVIASILGSNGSQFINGVYGFFQSTSSQTVAGTNTPTQVALDTTAASGGVTLASNKVTVSVAGTYRIEYAAQIVNTSATNPNNAFIWLRKNGSDVANSTNQSSAVAQHSSINGYAVQTGAFMLALAANDYIEFYWMADSTSVQLYNAAAGTAPAVASFSAAVTLTSS